MRRLYLAFWTCVALVGCTGSFIRPDVMTTGETTGTADGAGSSAVEGTTPSKLTPAVDAEPDPVPMPVPESRPEPEPMPPVVPGPAATGPVTLPSGLFDPTYVTQWNPGILQDSTAQALAGDGVPVRTTVCANVAAG